MTGGAVDVNHLIRRWSAGDREALDRLMPVVYDRLRELAHQRLRNEPGERTLNTTALVHEAYLRLVDSPDSTLRDRSQFLALASHVMRHLLVDRARARNAVKRGGGVEDLPFEEGLWVRVDLDAFAELDEALRRLELLDPRQSSMLEQRYFGGLSLEETAAALDVSLATVKRELRSARAWLANELRSNSVAAHE
ncbi:MAG: polymerase sigma factor [Geminicoccaceae bacterium]|jgi:RNA polymerase sigma factor (TIGR02999 family)|nr:polymerase sigma factor [Geminicoccaceae bacterium]